MRVDDARLRTDEMSVAEAMRGSHTLRGSLREHSHVAWHQKALLPSLAIIAPLLKSSQDDQHYHNDENQSYPSTGVISPTRTVWPGGQGREEEQDQNDEQERSHRGCLLRAYTLT